MSLDFMANRFTGSVALALMAALTPIMAHAQETQDEASRRSMTLLVSAFGAYDADLEHPLPSQEKAKQTVDPGLQMTLDYRRPGPRFTFGWRNSGHVQRYSVADRLVAVDGDVGVTLSGRLTRRTTLRLMQTVAYAPQYTFGALPVLAPAPAQVEQPIVSQSRVTTDRLLSFDTTAGLQYDLGQRSALVLEYTRRQAAFIDLPSGSLASDRVLGRFTHQLSRHASARIGYGRQIARDGAMPTPTTTQDFDTGVDYRRDISLTRRTRLAFAGGTSVVAAGQIDALATGSDAPTPEVNPLLTGFTASAHQEDAPATGAAARTREVSALLTGSALLTHQFGRDWTAGLNYSRNISFSERLPAPTLTDAVAADATGLLGRRFTVSVTALYATGRVLTPVGNPFRNASASARVGYTLGRRLGLFATYALQQHRFATMEQLPSWLRDRNHQWNARTGLTWRLPLLR